MMRLSKYVRAVDTRLSIGFAALTLVVWLADALVRVTLLPDTDFPGSLIAGGSVAIWTRGAVFAALLIGWLVAKLQVDRRHEADLQWRRSRAILGRAIEGVNGAVWEIDLRTGDSWSAPGRSAVPGMADGGAPPVDMTAAKLIHPDDRVNWSRAFADHLAGETDEYSCEFRVRTRDGTYRWLMTRGKVTRDLNGTPIRLSGTSADVTTLKRSERMAEESHRAFLALIDESETGMFIAGSREIVHVNQAIVGLLGYESIDDLIGCSVENLIHPADQPGADLRIDSLRNGASPAPAECLYVRSDGSTIVLEFSMMSIGGFGGEFAMLGTLRDLEHHLRTEGDLGELRQRHARVVTEIEDAVWEIDLRLDQATRSARWFEMQGYEAADFEQSPDPILEILHPEDRGLYERDLRSQSLGETEYSHSEWRLRDQSGRYRWYRIRSWLTRDQFEWPVLLSGSMTDITFRKEAEGAFQRDAKEIGNLNARLGLLTKLSGLIAARAPVEDLRQACVTGLLEVIDCERAAITLTDRSTGRPSVLVQRTRSATKLLRPLPGETNGSRFDLQKTGPAARKYEPADRNRPPASIVAVPYEESGAADGTLSMETGREDGFTESDSQFLRTLAAHIEIAALGAGRAAPGDSEAALAPMKPAIPAPRTRGDLIPEGSDSRTSAFSSLAEIREAGIDRVFDAIGCDHVAIVGLDPDSGGLDIVAERRMTGDRPEGPLRAESPLSIGTLTEHHNKMLASPDRTYRSASRLHSIALVAIDVRGEVAGSLAVASRREYGLDDLSVELLRATAEKLGEAIGAFQVLDVRRRLRRTRDLEHLSASVAHHINNDAAVIEFALAAITSEEDESRRESMEIIRRSARGIAGGARLIRAYIDGAGAEQLQKVDLAALVEEALGPSEPVDQSRPAPRVDTPEPPANIVGSTILVIDDEAMLRRSLARVLDREGCETSVAGGGEEALEIFTVERFDAVICDLKMPGIDGWEVAEKMHQINPDCPVIILTGVTGTTSDELKSRPGVAALLEKPCSVADISRTVSRVAGR